ncbi:MAG TPA: helical backbone metal receptor [Kofleriaceae bacterium]|jgi:iron complex transport system substrate-binding protein|nr:helical backbone metal receptor [Kofleriaceae bacterium]
MRRLVVLLVLLLACQRNPGRTDEVQRVVSLTPSGTEIVAALGATDLLVGVDDYSKFPESVQQLPKVGSFIAPKLETIVRLRPSLVIVDDIHGAAAGALRDAGVTAVECPMHDLPDVKSALRVIGERLGRADAAAAAIGAIDKALDGAAAHKPAHHPRVLAVIDREAGGLGNIVAAGPGSWLDELLAVVGGDNVLAASSTRYPKISTEEVLRAQPEVILDLSFNADAGAWNAVDVPAVRAHRVRVLTEDTLSHPSPRVDRALATLAGSIK